MFALYFAFMSFFGAVQPHTECTGAWGCCTGCAGTGPSCQYEFDLNGNSIYTCSIPSCGGGGGNCSYTVGTGGGNFCRCYDYDQSIGFFEIPCPFNDCYHGTCKTCQLDKPGTPAPNWGDVKRLYR